MTSDDNTANAVGLPRRSTDWRSDAMGGPRTAFLNRYRAFSGRSSTSGDGRASGATWRPAAGPRGRGATWTDAGSTPEGTVSPGPGTGTSLTPSGNHIP